MELGLQHHTDHSGRGSLSIPLLLLTLLTAEVHCVQTRGSRHLTLNIWLINYHNLDGKALEFGTTCQPKSCNPVFRVDVFTLDSTVNKKFYQDDKDAYKGNNEVKFKELSKGQIGMEKNIELPALVIKPTWEGKLFIRVQVSAIADNGMPAGTIDSYTKELPVDPPVDPATVTLQSSDRPGGSEFSFNYSMKCDEHFYGKMCHTFCEPKNSDTGHYSCTRDGKKRCLKGWKDSESDCQRQSACISNPCAAPLECVDEPEGGSEFSCRCPKGRKGSKCELDINECLAEKPPCSADEKCSNSPGSYVCRHVPECAAMDVRDKLDCLCRSGHENAACTDELFKRAMKAMGSGAARPLAPTAAVILGAAVAMASCLRLSLGG